MNFAQPLTFIENLFLKENFILKFFEYIFLNFFCQKSFFEDSLKNNSEIFFCRCGKWISYFSIFEWKAETLENFLIWSYFTPENFSFSRETWKWQPKRIRSGRWFVKEILNHEAFPKSFSEKFFSSDFLEGKAGTIFSSWGKQNIS